MRLVKLGALMIILPLLLSGCGGSGNTNSRTAELRQSYADLTFFSGTAEVTADYGDRVYQYEVAVSGDLTGGTLEVTAPDSIAGASFTWSDGVGCVEYGSVTLETGALSPDGLSPADGVSLLLTALATGRELSCCEERLDGEETCFYELANPSYGETVSTVLVWLSQADGGLRRGEITWEGETVVTYLFPTFNYTCETASTED